jgi:AraC-like DNA-binding protein
MRKKREKEIAAFDIEDTLGHYSDKLRPYANTNGEKSSSKLLVPGELGLGKVDAASVNQIPGKSKHYSLLLGVKGQCDITTGYHRFTLKPGMLSLIAPYQLTHFHHTTRNFCLQMLLFSKEFLQAMYMKDGMIDELLLTHPDYPPVFAIPAAALDAVKGGFSKIEKEFVAKKAFHLDMIRLRIVELLYHYNRACEYCLLSFSKRMNRQYQLTYQFKKLVDEHFLHKRTVADYASLLHISPKHLGEMVKLETGSTALDMIHQRLLMESQYLLKHADLNIKGITDHLQFDTTSHFSRFFKSKTGITPVEYRTKP